MVSVAWKTYFENQLLIEISTVDSRGQLITNLNRQMKAAYEKGGITVAQLDLELQNKIQLIKRPATGAKNSNGK